MATLRWLLALLNERYEAHYWESVAQNERWLALLIELTDNKKQ
jgi:hypothetical protein